jgi:hypothetical protein
VRVAPAATQAHGATEAAGPKAPGSAGAAGRMRRADLMRCAFELDVTIEI